jgi:dephospho-CoA kinase
MKSLGLTGGVGMGKSTSAQVLRSRRVAVVDTDELAREVVQPGQPALAQIQQAFGRGMIGPDGLLRRAELARIVFADEVARKRLEEMLHPLIRERWRAQLADWRQRDVPLAFVVIPLLFEINEEAEFDETICVACSAATQWQRLRLRGWRPEHIQQRLAAQWPVEEKIARANYLVWTEGSLGAHAWQLERIIERV